MSAIEVLRTLRPALRPLSLGIGSFSLLSASAHAELALRAVFGDGIAFAAIPCWPLAIVVVAGGTAMLTANALRSAPASHAANDPALPWRSPPPF